MIQEIQLIQSFNHPNIVNMVETYEGDNSYYIILELLEGLSLQQHLKKSQYAMTYDDIKQIMIVTQLTYISKY
jgi:phosphorylase kinase gamma subunit